jgi:hypothetical protein
MNAKVLGVFTDSARHSDTDRVWFRFSNGFVYVAEPETAAEIYSTLADPENDEILCVCLDGDDPQGFGWAFLPPEFVPREVKKDRFPPGEEPWGLRRST